MTVQVKSTKKATKKTSKPPKGSRSHVAASPQKIIQRVVNSDTVSEVSTADLLYTQSQIGNSVMRKLLPTAVNSPPPQVKRPTTTPFGTISRFSTTQGEQHNQPTESNLGNTDVFSSSLFNHAHKPTAQNSKNTIQRTVYDRLPNSNQKTPISNTKTLIKRLRDEFRLDGEWLKQNFERFAKKHSQKYNVRHDITIKELAKKLIGIQYLSERGLSKRKATEKVEQEHNRVIWKDQIQEATKEARNNKLRDILIDYKTRKSKSVWLRQPYKQEGARDPSVSADYHIVGNTPSEITDAIATDDSLLTQNLQAVSGHGMTAPNVLQARNKREMLTVPPNTTITFWVPHFIPLPTTMANLLESGKNYPQMLEAYKKLGLGVEVYRAGDQVFNYMMTSFNDTSAFNPDGTTYYADRTGFLDEFFQKYQGKNIHWLACRSWWKHGSDPENVPDAKSAIGTLNQNQRVRYDNIRNGSRAFMNFWLSQEDAGVKRVLFNKGDWDAWKVDNTKDLADVYKIIYKHKANNLNDNADKLKQKLTPILMQTFPDEFKNANQVHDLFNTITVISHLNQDVKYKNVDNLGNLKDSDVQDENFLSSMGQRWYNAKKQAGLYLTIHENFLQPKIEDLNTKLGLLVTKLHQNNQLDILNTLNIRQKIFTPKFYVNRIQAARKLIKRLKEDNTINAQNWPELTALERTAVTAFKNIPIGLLGRTSPTSIMDPQQVNQDNDDNNNENDNNAPDYSEAIDKLEEREDAWRSIFWRLQEDGMKQYGYFNQVRGWFGAQNIQAKLKPGAARPNLKMNLLALKVTVQSKFDQLESTRDNLQTQYNDLGGKENVQGKANNRLTGEILDVESDIRRLKADVIKLQNQEADQNKDNSGNTGDQVTKLQQKINEQNQLLKRLESKRKVGQNKYSQINLEKAQIEKSQGEIEALENFVEEFEDFNQAEDAWNNVTESQKQGAQDQFDENIFSKGLRSFGFIV